MDELHEYLTDMGTAVPDNATWRDMLTLAGEMQENAWIMDNEWKGNPYEGDA